MITRYFQSLQRTYQESLQGAYSLLKPLGTIALIGSFMALFVVLTLAALGAYIQLAYGGTFFPGF